MSTKYLRSAMTSVNEIITRTILHLGRNHFSTEQMRLDWALESIAAIYTTTMTVADMAADEGGAAVAEQVQALREMAEDIRIKGDQVHSWKNPLNALDGMEENISIDGRRIAAQMVLLLERIENPVPSITAADEQAIRRAAWSSFHRKGHCHCPYPVGHAHREIWIDEAAAIAAEFSDEILAEPPQAEVITLEAFCIEVNRQNAEQPLLDLPIYEVQNGTVKTASVEPETPQTAEIPTKRIKSAISAAKRWRKQHDNPTGGVVVVHGREASGWMNELRDPQGWEPNCIAVAENGELWLSHGGDAYHGAKEWRPVTAIA